MDKWKTLDAVKFIEERFPEYYVLVASVPDACTVVLTVRKDEQEYPVLSLARALSSRLDSTVSEVQ
jgi:hypothetical protein